MYGFEVRTKSGKLIARSVTPYSSLKSAKEMGRIHLLDANTPKGSRLEVFKMKNKKSDFFDGF